MSPYRGSITWVCAALLAGTISCSDNGTGPPSEPPPGCPTLGDYLHVQAVGRPPGTVIDAAVVGSHVFSLNREDGLFALNFLAASLRPSSDFLRASALAAALALGVSFMCRPSCVLVSCA